MIVHFMIFSFFMSFGISNYGEDPKKIPTRHKLKTHKQRTTNKMCNLKINSHHVVSEPPLEV